jgi:hypothetical protein
MRRVAALNLLGNLPRLVLTALAVIVFVYLLTLLSTVHGVFARNKAAARQQTFINATRMPQPVVSPRPDVFWPAFPRSSAGASRESVLNGVRVITENWRSTAAGADILDYYRRQMAARGWADVTEEVYGLNPGLRGSLHGDEQLQDERYLQVYRDVMDSSLALRRGNWSMHVSVQPTNAALEQTSVKIVAAETPQMKEFFAALGTEMANPGTIKSATLSAVQHNGRERYATTVTRESDGPSRSFEIALEKLRREGWEPAVLLPPQRAQKGFFAWLTRGEEYAALSVSSAGRGSSVTLTRVTPNRAALPSP